MAVEFIKSVIINFSANVTLLKNVGLKKNLMKVS